MTTLYKLTNLVYSAGSPYVPADPGTAAAPGYYTNVTSTVKSPVYGWEMIQSAPLPPQPPGQALDPRFQITGGGLYFFHIIGYTSQSVTTQVWVPPVLARAPTPAIPAQQPGVVADLNVGWNSYADTVAMASGDTIFTFKLPAASVGVVVGLSRVRNAVGYGAILHGLYASRGSLLVVESGVVVSVPQAYIDTDTLGVARRAGTTVTYTKNGVAFYTSPAATSEPVSGAAALYTAGDSVIDALLAPLAALGASSASFEPLTASAFGGAHSQASAQLERLTAAGSGHNNVGILASFEPLAALGANRPMAGGTAHLEPLVGSATAPGLFAPQYAASYGAMAYLLGAGHMLTGGIGQASVALPMLRSVGSDHPYAYADTALEPLAASSGTLVLLDITVDVTAPMATLYATVHDSTGENAANISAPMASVQAFMGDGARITAPMATVSASATGTNWLNADITAPMGTLSASATVSGTSQANIVAPMATVIGYGGMVCSVTLKGMPTVVAQVSSGSVMNAGITCPLAELTFHVTAENRFSINALAPAGRMGANLQAYVMAPMATLTAIGTAVVTASNEAYNINLSHRGEAPDEVTRYTNFPFTQVVRYRNSYFGVAADGLYLLEGTTDNGAPIAYAVKTCVDDLKMAEKKTAASVYLAGRIGPALTVTLHAGETGQESYAYSTPRGQGAQNHREKFGRGVKNRYFALSLAGTDALELDSLELEINKLSRKI